MSQREYWDSVADTKKFTTKFQINEFSECVKKEGIILDVGCGYGRTLNELYEEEYRNLIGMDFSQGMINQGKQKYPYLDFRLQQAGKIDLANNSVDAVILLGVLTCIVNNNEQKNLIKEIYRVLKPDGIVYINDFLLNSDERNLARYEKYKEKYGVYGTFELSEGGAFRHHSEEWIENLLQNFKTIKFKKMIFTTMNGNKSNGFYYIGEKFEK